MVSKKIRKKVYLPFLLLILCIPACTKNEEPQPTQSVRQIQREQTASAVEAQSVSQEAESAMDADSLDKIAELERSGQYSPGLGFAESGIRERAGDYAGAVVAAYKEMAWSFALGDTGAEGAVTLEQIKEGLNSISALYSVEKGSSVEDFRRNAHAAVTAVSYFIDRKWTDAKDSLESLFADDEEADSFAQWMILVCSLEQGDASRAERSRYGAIRSRYEYFPEYWYHLARYLNDDAARMDAAERCIFLASRGPYASECRALIAEIFNIEDSLSSSILIARINRPTGVTLSSCRDASRATPSFSASTRILRNFNIINSFPAAVQRICLNKAGPLS